MYTCTNSSIHTTLPYITNSHSRLFENFMQACVCQDLAQFDSVTERIRPLMSTHRPSTFLLGSATGLQLSAKCQSKVNNTGLNLCCQMELTINEAIWGEQQSLGIALLEFWCAPQSAAQLSLLMLLLFVNLKPPTASLMLCANLVPRLHLNPSWACLQGLFTTLC